MKLKIILGFLILQSFVVVKCSEYKILKVNCTSSDPNFVSIERCSHNGTHGHLLVTLKQPVKRIYVG